MLHRYGRAIASRVGLRRSLPSLQDGASLSIEGLSVAYGQLEVLHDISLHVEHGESVALLGANGAGKTSLLKTLSGVLRPTGGSILFGGVDLSKLRIHELVRLGIAHVPEGRQILVGLTVEDNLRIAQVIRSDKYEAGQDLDFVLRMFPALKEKLGQRAGELSGGQQQMLAIGRALAANPKLLLLDEPSLGLAPALIDEMSARIEQIRAERSLSIVLVEQNVAMAANLTDRTYVMQTGSIVSEERSDSLLGRRDLLAAYLGTTAR
jgi:branched-chain amino acid transport system ATP-binding protein